MKKALYFVLVVVMCIGLIGCGKKKEEGSPIEDVLIKEISVSNEIYHDKNHYSKDGSSTTEITLYSDGTMVQRSCSLTGNCNFYSGEYDIAEEVLTITLVEWMNAKGTWEELPSSRVSLYDITEENTFVSRDDSSMEFVLE